MWTQDLEAMSSSVSSEQFYFIHRRKKLGGLLVFIFILNLMGKIGRKEGGEEALGSRPGDEEATEGPGFSPAGTGSQCWAHLQGHGCSLRWKDGQVFPREEMLQMEPTGKQMAQPAKGDEEVSRRSRGRAHGLGLTGESSRVGHSLREPRRWKDPAQLPEK